MANIVVTVIFAQRFENDKYLFSCIEKSYNRWINI